MIILCKKCLLCVFSSALTRELKVCVYVCVCVHMYINKYTPGAVMH